MASKTAKSYAGTSYKSKAESNYEEMDLKELEIEYETTEKDLNAKLREFAKLSGSAQLRRAPLKSRETKLEPIEAEMKLLRNKMIYLLQLRNQKTPAFEKIPKDH